VTSSGWVRLAELDARLSNRLRVAEKPGLLRNISILLAHSGDSWFWFLGLALLFWLGGNFWRQRSIILAGGILVTAALVMAIKFTVRRRRPEGEWGGIYRKTDPHSFPSGHAARAILLAMLATGLGPAWFAIAMWIWAPLVVLARVSMGLHFLSDVLAGAALGLAMGGVIIRLLPAFLF
jgi:undecaprenyl-diphosphatase